MKLLYSPLHDIESPAHSIHAAAKMVGFFTVIVICVSTRYDAYAAFAGYFAIMMTLLFISRIPARHVFKRSLVIIPFVLMTAIFLPFFRPDMELFGFLPVNRAGLVTLWNAFIKAYIGVLGLTIFSATTPYTKFLAGLSRLGAPKMIVMTLGFFYRYLFVFAEEAGRMRRAARARLYDGRWIWHSVSVGHIIGSLFLRSFERGERVYTAMTARGFQGYIDDDDEKTPFAPRDFVFVAGVVTPALILRLTI